MNRFFHSLTRLAGLAGLLVILAAAGGCQHMAPVRTLPTWVRGVYIPVFRNMTYETQIEDLATRLTQQAFLADGRVDVVPKEKADLVLKVELLRWDVETIRTSGDYIGRTSEVTLTIGVKLFDPDNMQEPRADLGQFRLSSAFNGDTRSTRYQPEPDRKAQLLTMLANQIVTRVINGFPATVPDLPPGTAVPQFRTPETIQMNDVLKARPEQDAPR